MLEKGILLGADVAEVSQGMGGFREDHIGRL
jgi:hypothetical protein